MEDKEKEKHNNKSTEPSSDKSNQLSKEEEMARFKKTCEELGEALVKNLNKNVLNDLITP